MSELIARGAVLTFSRISNFAIQLLSPLMLVRILDVESYGQYQEFTIYAVLLTGLCTFSVDSSLTYFLPRFPERERVLLFQTTILTLVLSASCLLGLLLARPLFLQITSWDFVAPLATYVFFFVNVSWFEYYWIAKRQAKKVLVYSAVRLMLRVSVLLFAALLTRDVLKIVWSLATFEGLRVAWALIYAGRRRLLGGTLSWNTVREQLAFAAPIGAAAFVQNFGRNIGKIVVSSALGPVALAYYAIGSYLIPIIRVMRSGISDAIYPDLVSARDQPEIAVRLWQRVNVLNCVMFVPAFVVLLYYAEPIVTILFTPAYAPAAPVFSIFAFFLIRRCFNTDVLVRTTGRTGFLLWGTLGSLIINVGLTFILSHSMGILGPAIAFLVAECVLELYYAREMARTMKLRISQVADWNAILRILASCVISLPLLIGLDLLPLPSILRIAVAAIAYFSMVCFVAYQFGVLDIGRVAAFALARIRRLSIL